MALEASSVTLESVRFEDSLHQASRVRDPEGSGRVSGAGARGSFRRAPSAPARPFGAPGPSLPHPAGPATLGPIHWRSSTRPMSPRAEDTSPPPPAPRRVHPRVALTLLETIRDQDLPAEVLESEDPAVTLPRRLGLSDAVEQQIRRFREAVRKRRRISDEELTDLIRLVIRRPDAEDVFFLVGQGLAGGDRSRFQKVLPSGIAYALARRRVRRRLKALFGRSVGGFARGSFVFEGRALPFIQSDPGGDACAIVSGLCQAVVRRYLRDDPLVVHVACQSRENEVCRWTVREEEDEE